jgi:hypothetical protein
MSGALASVSNSGPLAAAVLAAHLVVIGFNLFGLVAIPMGAWRGWDWVRIRWWRWLHVGSLAVVALQAVAGRACFLTLWQGDLEGAGEATPLIARWVNGLIYWDLPLWAFTAVYVLVFVYVLALLRLVPARGLRRAAGTG